MEQPRVHGQLCRGRHPGYPDRPETQVVPPHGRTRPGRRALAQEAAPEPASTWPRLRTCSIATSAPADHDERWVADITEFMTDEGKLFLARRQGPLHGRGLVGWSMGTSSDLGVGHRWPSRWRCRGGTTVIPHAAPQRQGMSIHLARLDQPTATSSDSAHLVWIHRRLLRQRGHGDLLGHRQTRAELDPRTLDLHERGRDCAAPCFDYIEIFYNRERAQAGSAISARLTTKPDSPRGGLNPIKRVSIEAGQLQCHRTAKPGYPCRAYG